MVKRIKTGHEPDSAGELKLPGPSGSRVFSPFRTVGLVTTGVPFSVTTLGQSFVITSSVGRSFQIYDASNLHLLFVSYPQCPSPISCVLSHHHYVFAAWDQSVGLYKRGRLLAEITVQETVKDMVLFGDYLVVLGQSELFVYLMDFKTNKFSRHTSIHISSTLGPNRALVHMATYLNKAIVVSESTLSIFNVRTGNHIFTTPDNEFDSPIVCVEPAPVLDVIAVATRAGSLYMYNLKKAEILFRLELGETAVQSMSFRTDGTPFLALGTSSGDLFFYNLNTKRRVHSVRAAHSESGGVARVQFLTNQAICVSAGADNRIQELVFDPPLTAAGSTSSPPRVLRSRGGHMAPPTQLTFTDEEAHFLLSASQDQSLWSFSLRKDSQNKEFSQKLAATDQHGNRVAKFAGKELGDRFPEITAMAYEANKQQRWDNIVTAHKGLTFARVWSGQNGIVGKHRFDTADGSIVKAVTISRCGNFALVGSSKGSISVYNLQSGMLKRHLKGRHQGKPVTGVAMDAINTTIVSSGLDGSIQFHDFATGNLVQTVPLEASIAHLCLHHATGLVAVSLDNLSICILDTQTRKLVRELVGHSNRITSFDFSPDGRSLVSAGLDSTIRTWDLPTGQCVDAVRVASIVTCLRLSPNGDWLATSHVKGVGIQLWSRKAQFQKAALKPIRVDDDSNLVAVDMPNSIGEGSNALDGAFDESDQENTAVGLSSTKQLSSQLMTLSLEPKNKFKTMLNLDTIRTRNKPKEAPKKPQSAPFFLSLTEADKNGKSEPEQGAAKKAPSTARFESKFTALLREQDDAGFLDYIRTMSASATDMEIRSLNTLEPYSELISFIGALTQQLQRHTDFELVQTWMNMLMRIHGDVILQCQSPELLMALDNWREVQRIEAERLNKLAQYCSGVLDFFRAV